MAARSFGPAYVKRTVRFNATRKGLLGGSRPWLAVFGLMQLVKWSGKVTKRGDAPIKFGESLQPGESFVISHVAPPTKAKKRKGSSPA